MLRAAPALLESQGIRDVLFDGIAELLDELINICGSEIESSRAADSPQTNAPHA